MQITYIVYDGCKYSGILGIQDTLEIANLWACTLKQHQYKPVFSSRVVTITGQPVQTEKNVLIQPDIGLSEASGSKMIVIPAYFPKTSAIPENITPVIKWLKKEYRSKAYIASLCTGSFILAMTGLLDNKQATTNWQYTKAFTQKFPRVKLTPEEMVTEDERLICSGSATALFNLGLYLIEKFGSKELSAMAAKSMLIDINKTSQEPYTVFNSNTNHQDRQISRVQHWMDANYANPISMEDAAAYAGISYRQFKRRFKKATNETPLAYLQKIRVDSAKKMLERTCISINDITLKVGYEDTSTFRRMFKKMVTLSPREYRDKFSTF